MDVRTDCNLKCPMCYVHGDPEAMKRNGFVREDLPLAEAINVLDQLIDAEPLVMPSLWSEPLLSKQFREFAAEIKKRGFTLALNSNGLLLKEDLAEYLVELEVDAVSISIDATTKETLKVIRGIDKLEKIHRSVEIMKKARGSRALPRIGVSFTVQAGNQSEEEAFIEYWAHRVDFVRVGELFEDGRFPNLEINQERHSCPSLYSTMAIHANGDVSVCCLDGFRDAVVGNVFKESVAAVWNGEKYNEVRHLHETGRWDEVPFCKNCDRWASYGHNSKWSLSAKITGIYLL